MDNKTTQKIRTFAKELEKDLSNDKGTKDLLLEVLDKLNSMEQTLKKIGEALY